MRFEDKLTTLPGAAPYRMELQEKLLNAMMEKSPTYSPRTKHRDEKGSPLYTNRLILEVSPYLLQHAHNPVNWYSWGDEAFEAAKEEGKLIFLSIGYSTCHWCHVMEEESFDDLEVASILNQHFIAIKVDREERPDIDNVYMAVCQKLTGSGGWPLTIILTPDAKPVFAGTYFPKISRFGRPGMMELLPSFVEAYDKNPGEFNQVAGQIEAAMLEIEKQHGGGRLTIKSIEDAYSQLAASFDAVRGGFGKAPKFPTPHHLTFLLRHWKRSGEPTALEMVEKTLREMRLGGIYDHIGFGFHRYSTDADWLVPHFEKMLYDQALMALAYTEAYQAAKDEVFARTAREIFTYVLRDMTSPMGGFYSAEDADSEGEEGKFYLWTADEIRDILGDGEGDLFLKVYNVEEDGNFSGDQPNANILYLKKPLGLIARELGIEAVPLELRLEESRRRLFEVRERRTHPLKDDKILVAWNGLMISALAKGYQALGDEELETAARRAADFILSKMLDGRGRLVRRYRNGEASLPAHINDYAFMVQGLLDLYEATFDLRYLKEAILLNDRMIDMFWDKEDGGLFYTAETSGKLLVRRKEIYDGAIPSGNSVAALNLLRLERITAQRDNGIKAGKIMSTFSERVTSYPAAFTQLMVALDFSLGPTREVVIAGRPGSVDTRAMIRSLQEAFIPNKVVIFRPTGDGSPGITKIARYTEFQTGIDGRATAYVCQNFACKAPTDDISIMMDMLGIPGD